MQYLSLVSDLSNETFQEVVSASPRRIRETLFGRLGIKAKKKKIGVRVHGKMEDRTKKLHERLREASTAQEDELCGELLRNWLYTQRALLAATLDHLGVKHDDGLVDEDPAFFKEPGLETLRRQFKYELADVLGNENLVDEVLITKLMWYTADM